MKKLTFISFLLLAVVGCKKQQTICDCDPAYVWHKETGVYNGQYVVTKSDTVYNMTEEQVNKFVKDSTIITENYRRVYTFTKL